MYNLIEHGNNYLKIWGSLWHYHRDEPALTDAGASKKFHDSDNSVLCLNLNKK